MKWTVPVPTQRQALEKTLSSALGLQLTLDFHDNISIFLRYETRSANSAALRLHESFVHASDEVLRHLIVYLRSGKKRSLGYLRLFLEHPFFHKTCTAPPQNTKGAVYELDEVYRFVEEKYLPYPLALSIGWFRTPRRKKRTSLTYGSFCRRNGLIRINQVLDVQEVPRYFLEYVVYHEAVHAICSPILSATGKVIVHTKEFKQREKMFPRFQEALHFERQFFRKYIQEKMHYGRS